MLRDIMIADHLAKRLPVNITFISYGTGGRALASAGYEYIDLQLPDGNAFLETVIRATRVVSEKRPDVVIAHEEFAALIAAKAYGTPTIFLTDWFLDPNHILMQSLEYADEILFLEESGYFTEPPNLHTRVTYAGPISRELRYKAGDKALARKELQIDDATFVLGCLPGTTYESSSPIFGIVLSAYDQLTVSPKQMIWVDSANYEEAKGRFAYREDVTVVDTDWKLERVIVSSDVVISKCTRNTLRECNLLGVPSVSLSHGLNWIDDAFANRLASNIWLNAKTTNSRELADSIMKVSSGVNVASKSCRSGLDVVIERITRRIDAIKGQKR